jgi:N-acetylated-alpha-linked acidic dipeptidase
MNRVIQSSSCLAAVLLVFSIAKPAGKSVEQTAASNDVKTQGNQTIFGFRDSTAELKWEKIFLAAPDPKRAEGHLRVLTAAPHMAATPEDRQTAEYVAQKFREAGLETQVVAYKVWMNYPQEISVEVVAPNGVNMHGPTREHVEGDSYQEDPRVVLPFNEYSPSGDAEADVVYANYGRTEDFKKLEEMKIDVRGKIVLTRYGHNFRGVKAYVAQQHGAAGVLIYSDPIDDGYFKGDPYPKGPWRPTTGVQRGSIGYMFQFPGDPTTPGVASVESLPDSERIPLEKSESLPRIPTTPLSYGDAQPILANLGGPESPRDWQGALPFTYHVGAGPVRVKMHLKQEYAFRTIWNVIGQIRGTDSPEEWVVAGNHRDAWAYGAVDPNSGTAAMLEAVHGLGELLKAGWKPKRSIAFGSWDGEEQGLVGSTEWGEEHERDLANAVAYFNVDVAVSGPTFGASSVPSLKAFIREVAKAVPSPKGGSVYDVWRKSGGKPSQQPPSPFADVTGSQNRRPVVSMDSDAPVGDLGSGSDYTVFLQHLGIPSADIGSSGSYGVYHSVFDNFQWFTKFADPTFVYEQEMARIFGLQVIRMADADVLPYDYEAYGKEIGAYIEVARKKAEGKLGSSKVDFFPAVEAAKRLTEAGSAVASMQKNADRNAKNLNAALRNAERAFLLPNGLPNRPWYRHAIYAPGVYTGYAAVVIPGVNEAIDEADVSRTRQQLVELTRALDLAAKMLRTIQ